MLSSRRRPRLHVYYGWWIVAGAVLAMTFGSGLGFFSYGLFIGPLEQDFGWSRAQVSLGYSFSYVASGLMAPFVGKLIDSRGPRLSIGVGAALTAISFVLLAQTAGLWQWYLFRSINAGFYQMMFFIPINALVSRWFVARRGVALMLAGVGVQLGGFLVVPLVQVVINSFGWQGAFYFSAIVTAGVFLPAALFVFKDSPASMGLKPDGGRSTSRSSGAGLPGSIGVAQAIRKPHFWLLALGFGLLLFGITGWAVHQVPFWISVGYSGETAVLLAALVSGVGILFRLGFGVVIDRIERYEGVAMISSILLAVGMLILPFEVGVMGIGGYFFFRSLGGTAMMLESLLLLKSFGITHFATLLGIVVVVETIAEIISPWVAGLMFDSSQSYDKALVMFAAAFLLASVMFAIASRLPRPLDQITHST